MVRKGKNITHDELIRALKGVGFPDKFAVSLAIQLTNKNWGYIIADVLLQAIKEVREQKAQHKEKQREVRV